MNKKTITFGVAALLIFVSMRWAQAEDTEKILGPVIAVEREFALDLNACRDAFKKKFYRDNTGISFGCEVDVFPRNDEERFLSSSIYKDDVKSEDIVALLTTIRGKKFMIHLIASLNGFSIYGGQYDLESYPELKDITKEDFLKIAKTLIDRFPRMSVRASKVGEKK